MLWLRWWRACGYVTWIIWFPTSHSLWLRSHSSHKLTHCAFVRVLTQHLHFSWSNTGDQQFFRSSLCFDDCHRLVNTMYIFNRKIFVGKVLSWKIVFFSRKFLLFSNFLLYGNCRKMQIQLFVQLSLFFHELHGRCQQPTILCPLFCMKNVHFH